LKSSSSSSLSSSDSDSSDFCFVFKATNGVFFLVSFVVVFFFGFDGGRSLKVVVFVFLFLLLLFVEVSFRLSAAVRGLFRVAIAVDDDEGMTAEDEYGGGDDGDSDDEVNDETSEIGADGDGKK
jgi:hypothetical protein